MHNRKVFVYSVTCNHLEEIKRELPFGTLFHQEQEARNGGTSRRKNVAEMDDDDGSSSDSSSEEESPGALSYRTPFLTQAC